MPHDQGPTFLTGPHEDRTSSFIGPFKTASASPAGRAGDPGVLGPAATQAQHWSHSSNQPASLQGCPSGQCEHLLDSWLPAPSMLKLLPRRGVQGDGGQGVAEAPGVPELHFSFPHLWGSRREAQRSLPVPGTQCVRVQPGMVPCPRAVGSHDREGEFGLFMSCSAPLRTFG